MLGWQPFHVRRIVAQACFFYLKVQTTHLQNRWVVPRTLSKAICHLEVCGKGQVRCCQTTSHPAVRASVSEPSAEMMQKLDDLGVDLALHRQALGVLKKLKGSVDLIDFLKGKGASQQVVASIVCRYPRSLSRSAEHLEERWTLWRKFFNSDGDVLKIVMRSPEAFFRSSDNATLAENIEYFTSLGLAKKDILRIFSTAPRALSNTPELNKQMVDFLKCTCVSLGGGDPDIFAQQVISRNVYILIRSTKRVKTNMEFLVTRLQLTDKELLGFLTANSTDALDMSSESLKRKLEAFWSECLQQGCNDQEVKVFFKKYSYFLYFSLENLLEKLHCLLASGITIHQVLERPRCLEFSLKTLSHRLQVLQSVGYDFEKHGINILNSNKCNFQAKFRRLRPDASD
ncbi:transcription termination factor 1b, mitochondrial-like [Petromyzon marinus]|uniref:transcription termination factor 1b, mitochondrial-like n=1 Tax=Petromyzon marinus TaxID=7757 RepID=UPI003F6E9987